MIFKTDNQSILSCFSLRSRKYPPNGECSLYSFSDLGGRGNKAFIEASTRPLSSTLMTLTSTSSPTSKTSETLAVRDHEISEM